MKHKKISRIFREIDEWKLCMQSFIKIDRSRGSGVIGNTRTYKPSLLLEFIYVQSKIYRYFSTHFYASWIVHKMQKECHICDMQIPSCYEHFSSVFQAPHTFHKVYDKCNIPVSSHAPKNINIKSIFTLFEMFIFCPKIQLWFPEKIFDFWWVKNSWKCCGFGLFSFWQLRFHEKNCHKIIWVKNSWKCWGFVKIELLDKKSVF